MKKTKSIFNFDDAAVLLSIIIVKIKNMAKEEEIEKKREEDIENKSTWSIELRCGREDFGKMRNVMLSKDILKCASISEV